MSTEVEAWAVCLNGKSSALFRNKENADEHAKIRGGTVVRLVGKMPRELRKVSTEVWISPCDVLPNASTLTKRLGFNAFGVQKTEWQTIKARITVEELPEEGEE